MIVRREKSLNVSQFAKLELGQRATDRDSTARSYRV
jgi:hypothetical protein